MGLVLRIPAKMALPLILVNLTTSKTAREPTRRRRRSKNWSAATAVEDFQEFVDLGLAVASGAGVEGMRHAMPQVVAERLLLDLVEGGARSADLGQHVDAVAVFLDHARHAAHLALNAAKPGKLGFLQL